MSKPPPANRRRPLRATPAGPGTFTLAFVPPHYAPALEKTRGWPYHMARALSARGIEVRDVGPIRTRGALLNRVRRRAYRSLLSRDFDAARRPAAAADFARQVEGRLAEIEPDAVLSTDSIVTALVRTDKPVVLWLDATFDNLVDLYPGYTNLSRRAIRDGHALEREALERCALAVYSSEWAAERAVAVYGIPRSRTVVVGWGANLESEPAEEKVEQFAAARPAEPCRLLFIGFDWKRKGGPTAVATTHALNEEGFPTELTVLGSSPKLGRNSEGLVRALGYIDKRSPEGRATFERELARAHLLLLATLADCTPLAIAEAAAFGVPTVANSVGGISEIVKDGTTGRLLPPGSPPAAYRDVVLEIASRPDVYNRLALAAGAEYRRRLNWRVSAETFESLLREHVLR